MAILCQKCWRFLQSLLWEVWFKYTSFHIKKISTAYPTHFLWGVHLGRGSYAPTFWILIYGKRKNSTIMLHLWHSSKWVHISSAECCTEPHPEILWSPKCLESCPGFDSLYWKDIESEWHEAVFQEQLFSGLSFRLGCWTKKQAFNF